MKHIARETLLSTYTGIYVNRGTSDVCVGAGERLSEGNSSSLTEGLPVALVTRYLVAD